MIHGLLPYLCQLVKVNHQAVHCIMACLSWAAQERTSFLNRPTYTEENCHLSPQESRRVISYDISKQCIVRARIPFRAKEQYGICGVNECGCIYLFLHIFLIEETLVCLPAVWIYVCMYVCMYVSVLRTYVCMYVCMYACMHVCRYSMYVLSV